MSRISVVGLGKLGAPLVGVLASKGHRVIGVDVRQHVVEQINHAQSPVAEPGLAELMKSNRERITATSDCRSAVLETDVTFVVVATPSEESGAFSLTHVLSAMETIGQAIRDKQEYHLVVLTSTVLPGSTGGEVLSVLERQSGKK